MSDKWDNYSYQDNINDEYSGFHIDYKNNSYNPYLYMTLVIIMLSNNKYDGF